jgi:hypothetical protein
MPSHSSGQEIIQHGKVNCRGTQNSDLLWRAGAKGLHNCVPRTARNGSKDATWAARTPGLSRELRRVALLHHRLALEEDFDVPGPRVEKHTQANIAVYRMTYLASADPDAA